MAKKILYISYDGMTDPLGQSQVLPYLAGLSKLGYEFTLLSFEKRERFKKSAAIIQSVCDINNIRWEYEFFSTRPPLLSKLYDSWKMKRRVKQLHCIHQFDFTHCRSYVSAAAGLYLKESQGVPFLFDMRGFWVDERVDNGQWNLGNPLYKFFYRLFKKKERIYLVKSKHIISLTEKGKEELVANYDVPPCKISVIPCCADLDHFDYHTINAEQQDNLRKELGLEPGDKVLSYLGSLGGWYLTEEMLDFFVVLKKNITTAKFLFITHDQKEYIVQAALKKGINTEAIIVRAAARKDVPLLLSLSDWSIFFIKDAYSKKASSPTKQGEIMAMGVPLICNDIGDTGRIVENTNAGIVIRQFSENQYNVVVERILQQKAGNKSAIRKGAYSYYDLDKGIALYNDVYKKVLL